MLPKRGGPCCELRSRTTRAPKMPPGISAGVALTRALPGLVVPESELLGV